MLVIVVWVVLFHRRARTFTEADGITARGALLTRARAWHEVYDIRVEPNPHKNGAYQPRLLTYVYDTDGHRLRLPHVDDLQLQDVGTEVADLRAVAARHRGAAWERRPSVEARIRRRAGHRRAWGRAWTGAFVVFFCMVAVLVVQLLAGEVVRPALLLLCVPLGSFVLLAALLNWRWESQVPRHLRDPESPVSA
jgi:hypothetical protein